MRGREHARQHVTYSRARLATSAAQTQTIDSLEADGVWCPMAHCNLKDDSIQYLPSLLCVRTFQKINDPIVSLSALDNIGAYTGETMAVCAYESPSHPALVAFDYQDGSVRWETPLKDLPGTAFGRRRPSGVLMAKMRLNGNPVRRYVYAANWAEFVAYAADGTQIWKRPTTDIAVGGPGWVGAPISLRFSEAKELVTVTSEGWVIKLNPVDGSTIDAYRMD